MTKRRTNTSDRMKTSPNTKAKQSKSKRRLKPKAAPGLNRYMQERLAITVLVITLALFGLVVVLYNLATDKQKEYEQKVYSQQSYDSRVLPYRRGDIRDRNGTILATSDRVYNLIIDPKLIMSSPDTYLEPALDALASCFEYDRGKMRELIEDNADKPYIRYARWLPAEEKEAFEAYKTEWEAQQKELSKQTEGKINTKIAGIWFEDEYKRKYPQGKLASSVVGFVTGDGTEGNTGIEQYYNSILTGVNGREYGYLSDETSLERVIKSPVNGNTIVTTIDVKIQKTVDKYIAQWEQEMGSDRVGVIVMDPNSGEVLAMSTDKQFDLNNPQDLKPFYTPEEIADMDDEEKTDARNQIWRNFCISDTFEPGSTSKIFTIAGALEEGKITGEESFLCDGYQEIGGWKLRCVKRTGHGMLTIPESLMASCNDVMMQVAAVQGKQVFLKYQQLFGFGSRTGIDLPGEADARGLVYTEDNMGPTELATNSFGQTYNCSMIQMAAAYCSVINGGTYYEPHVVKQILNDNKAVVKKFEPSKVRETVSRETSDYIKEALFRTVEEGTGGAAAIEGYEIGGKTGTAEKLPRSAKNYVVSFCGFAPVDDPKVLVYVVVDVPHTPDQPHSSYASGIFRNIMEEILPYLNVFSAGEEEEISDTVAEQLPQEEGISNGEEDETQGEGEEETEEEKVPIETDEFVETQEGDEGSDLPGGLSEQPAPSKGLSEEDIDPELLLP